MGRRVEKRRGAKAPPPSGYGKAPPSPGGIVLSIKFPPEAVAKIDAMIEERRRGTNPYTSRGEIVRELALAKLREVNP